MQSLISYILGCPQLGAWGVEQRGVWGGYLQNLPPALSLVWPFLSVTSNAGQRDLHTSHPDTGRAHVPVPLPQHPGTEVATVM